MSDSSTKYRLTFAGKLWVRLQDLSLRIEPHSAAVETIYFGCGR